MQCLHIYAAIEPHHAYNIIVAHSYWHIPHHISLLQMPVEHYKQALPAVYSR